MLHLQRRRGKLSPKPDALRIRELRNHFVIGPRPHVGHHLAVHVLKVGREQVGKAGVGPVGLRPTEKRGCLRIRVRDVAVEVVDENRVAGPFKQALVLFLAPTQGRLRLFPLGVFAAELQLVHHHRRKVRQAVQHVARRGSGLVIQDAEGPDVVSIRGDERSARVEFQAEIRHVRVLPKTIVRRQVVHDHPCLRLDCMGANGHVQARFVRVHPHGGLEPLPIVVDEVYQGNRSLKKVSRERGDSVKGRLRIGVEDVVPAKRVQTPLFFHDRGNGRRGGHWGGAGGPGGTTSGGAGADQWRSAGKKMLRTPRCS